jgi:cold shock CspA family protein
MQGMIVLYHPARRFGFIQRQKPTDETGDIFFHQSEFKGEGEPPLGAIVEFDLAQPLRLGQKPRAVNLRLVKAAEGGGR